MNANTGVFFLEIFVQFYVKEVGKVAVLHNIQNLSKIVCTIRKYIIKLNLTRCSKATELGIRSIDNVAATVITNNGK